MRNLRASLSRLVLGATIALLASFTRAQSYGPEDQVLTIGAAEFRPQNTTDVFIGDDGYLSYAGDPTVLAPLSLPEGALVERVCLYANDSDPDRYIQAGVVAVKLVPGGEAPDLETLGFIGASDSDIGYASSCTEAFSETLRGRTDIDGDGIADAVSYYVFANVPAATQNSLSLGGIQIFWKRQVSAPPATPTFGDVPASDPAFQHIEALVASGITAGCAGGNFCPEANLTRRQMAVFLAKALGLHWAP